MIDFSKATHTRDGTEIVAGPWKQSNGNWCFVCQDRRGDYYMVEVLPTGSYWDSRPHDLDLIPPEPEYVYINVFSGGKLGGYPWKTKDQADAFAVGYGTGYLRKPADADGPIEHVNLDGELWAMSEAKE